MLRGEGIGRSRWLLPITCFRSIPVAGASSLQGRYPGPLLLVNNRRGSALELNFLASRLALSREAPKLQLCLVSDFSTSPLLDELRRCSVTLAIMAHPSDRTYFPPLEECLEGEEILLCVCPPRLPSTSTPC